MSRVEDTAVARECTVFTQYLCGLRPTPYILEKYSDAQSRNPAFAAAPPFDRFLIRFARVHPAATKLADAYARLFAPASALRKRLILLLAVLESTAFSNAFLEHVDSSTKTVIVVRAAWRGIAYLGALTVSLIVLLPIHVVLGLGRVRGKG